MEIEDCDAFLRERLNRSWRLDERPDGRGNVPLAVDSALLAFDPVEWFGYWAWALSRTGNRAFDRDTMWLAYRLVMVWAGPPLYRLNVEEIEEAVARFFPGLAPALRDFAVGVRGQAG